MGLARTHGYAADIRVAVGLFRRAMVEAGEESRVRAEAEHGLASALMRMLDDLPAAARHARTAAELAERLGDQVALSRLSRNAGADRRFPRQAARNEDDGPGRNPRANLRAGCGSYAWASSCASFAGPASCSASSAASRTTLTARARQLEAARIEALELGDESSLPLILRYLSIVELSSGDWSAAGRWADDGYEAALQTGQPAQQSALAGSRALWTCTSDAHLRHAGWAEEGLALADTTGAAFGRLLSGRARPPRAFGGERPRGRRAALAADCPA